VIQRAAHPQVGVRLTRWIAEPAGKRDPQVTRDRQDAAQLILDAAGAEDAHDLHPHSQRMRGQPHALHGASQAHDAEEVALGCRGRLPGS
jgi:hypothetical protein